MHVSWHTYYLRTIRGVNITISVLAFRYGYSCPCHRKPLFGNSFNIKPDCQHQPNVAIIVLLTGKWHRSIAKVSFDAHIVAHTSSITVSRYQPLKCKIQSYRYFEQASFKRDRKPPLPTSRQQKRLHFTVIFGR